MAVTTDRSIPDILLQCGVTAYKLVPHSTRGRYSLPCPLPWHDDSQKRDRGGSFSIAKDGACRCFGCEWKGHITQLPNAIRGWNGEISPKSYKEKGGKTSNKNRDRLFTFQGATLEGLAKAKGLDAEWLAQELGWADIPYGRGKIPAVLIPYYRNSERRNPILRYRVGINEGERFRWHRFEPDQHIIPCGLQFLEDIRAAGYVILVEGETDFAVLRYHGFPVLGIAGATNFRKSDAQYLTGLDRVYVWQEPDIAGSTFVQAVAEAIPDQEVRVLASKSAKDPCELAHLAGKKFQSTIYCLMEQSQVYVVAADPEPTGDGLYTEADRQDIRDNIHRAREEMAGKSDQPYRGRPVYPTQEERINPETGEEEQFRSARTKSLWSHFVDQNTAMTSRYALGDQKIDMGLYRTHRYSHVDFPYPMENRAIFCPQVELAYYLEFADGPWEKGYSAVKAAAGVEPKRNPKVVAQENCLHNGFWTCRNHGHQFEGASYCSGKQDPWCGSLLSRQLARVILPEDRHYRITWITQLFRLDDLEQERWGDRLRQVWKNAQNAMSGINRRIKARKYQNQSRLIHRNVSFHLDYPVCHMIVKTTWDEEEVNITDKDVDRLIRELGGDAEIVWDSCTDNQHHALMHMIGAASASLISIDRGSTLDIQTRTYLFAAFWHGTKGEMLNSTLDWLQDLLKELPEPPKLKCKEADCGLDLDWVLDTRPGDQTTNPTSPDYLYKPAAHRRL